MLSAFRPNLAYCPGCAAPARLFYRSIHGGAASPRPAEGAVCDVWPEQGDDPRHFALICSCGWDWEDDGPPPTLGHIALGLVEVDGLLREVVREVID